MERVVTADVAEVVAGALELVPEPVLERMGGGLRLFEGCPIFSGLVARADFCAHWLYTLEMIQVDPVKARRRRHPIDVGTILHELGHRLQWVWVWGSDFRAEWGTVPVAHTGLPPILALVNLDHSASHRGHYSEQFAEAFRLWLSPPQVLRPWDDGAPARFYSASGALEPQNRRNDPIRYDRFDNRYLLGWFNELAGFDLDRPPRALVA